MKKFLSLVLVVVLVLGFASFASAGTITWGGNLRVWLLDVNGPDDSMSTFQFDRVALTFKDVLSDHEGISAEVQYRNYTSNDVTYTYSSNKLSSSGTAQVRLDSGYYYYNGLLGQVDQLQVGALAKLPFRLGLSKNCNFVDTGLGSKLKIGNCMAISYEMAAPTYTVGVGVGNGNQKDITNDVNTYEGSIYSIRLDAGKNFFGLVPGLRLGMGYNRQANDTAKLYDDDNYKTNQVIDLAYVTNLFWASVESGTSTLTTGGKDADDLKGIYVEAGINIGKNKVWVGRMINDDEDNPLVTYKDTLSPDHPISNIRDGNIVAAIIPVLTSSNFQIQYIWGDDYKGKDTGKELDVRYQVTF